MISVQIRFGNGERRRFQVADERRAEALRRLARELVEAKADAGLAAETLTTAATCSADAFEEIKRMVAGVAKRKAKAPAQPATKAVTFRALASDWLEGVLHRRYPDQVRLKGARSVEVDAGRIDLLNRTIGDVPLARFTLADAERAMASLPPGLTAATRRQYAQLIASVVKFAVYPCRLLERSPLPAGFLPKIKAGRAKSFLYPAEDRALLGCAALPFARRLLFGFLAREGMRLSEALALRWEDLDLKHGAVRLDRNKTDDPRAWALDPGVARALQLVHADAKPAPSALVFLAENAKLAAQLRRDLKAAGVERAELFERSNVRQPFRVHDLRATFVTLSLANGATEAWVADRTGHKSTLMIARYRRAARTAGELRLGSLAPLDVALPELASRGGGTMPGTGERKSRRGTVSKNSLVSTGSPSRGRTGTPFRAADFKSAASAIPPRGQEQPRIVVASETDASPSRPNFESSTAKR